MGEFDEFEDIARSARLTDGTYSVKKTKKDISIDGVIQRHCWHCKTYKPLEANFSTRVSKTGLHNIVTKKCYQSMCRPCVALYAQKRARIKKRQKQQPTKEK